MFTSAAFTGATLVLATSQVIVCVELPCQVTEVFGDVTRKGPAASVTSNCISS